MRKKAKVTPITPVVPWQVKLVVVIDCVHVGLGTLVVVANRLTGVFSETAVEQLPSLGFGVVIAFSLLALLVYGLVKANKLALVVEGLICIFQIASGGWLFAFVKMALLLSNPSRKYFDVYPKAVK